MKATRSTARPREPTSAAGEYGIGTARRHGSKTDWAGVGLGDAFRTNLDYFTRMAAQRLFYAACRKAQVATARAAGASGEKGARPKVKPQIAPCYTSYPAALAAHSAIGLSAFLEYQAWASDRVLALHLADYLKDPATADTVTADPRIYLRLAQFTTQTVQTRLLLEDLGRATRLVQIELYRIFAASQQTLRFASLTEIIHAVVLYGDLLPDWRNQRLHATTRAILNDLAEVSAVYAERLKGARPQDFVVLGATWVRSICTRLARYLPDPRRKVAGQASARAPGVGDKPEDEPPGRLGESSPALPAGRMAPLNGVHPPALFDSPGAADQAAAAMLRGESQPDPSAGTEAAAGNKEATETLERFADALEKAGGQKAQWEDARSDLLERTLRGLGFAETPIQGQPVDGHEIKLQMGDGETAGGEIHDQPLELSADLLACGRLLTEAQPITSALRQALYPNVEECVETLRLRTSGSLDPARLAQADFAGTVYKRYRIRSRADRLGRPLLLIACDGSASLNANEMSMLKVLAAAWLTSTARSPVQVLAGLYHSGTVRDGFNRPLVEWLHHPQKTTAVGRRESVRAVAALPASGTGVQSDALSLAFMLGEAQRLARDKMIYLILISDCEWNRSFQTERSGREEVRIVFEDAYANMQGRLHTTLVALGVAGETGFEDLLNRVIAVPDEKLSDYAGVAAQIGVYVAACMRERARQIAHDE